MAEPAGLDVTAGDRATGFGDFFRDTYPDLVRSLYLLTADLTEAEDLAQEALARAYERWERVGRMESPGGYVYRTAVNLNRKRLRGLAVRARRLLAMASRDARSPAVDETGAEVTLALARLPKGQREAFVLVEWVGMTADEAGPILGIAPGSVRSRISRARAALREELMESDG